MKPLLSPCAKCPFRKDCFKGWLGKKRMKEICDDTISGDQYFVCHETTEKPLEGQRLCAGKLILEERANSYGNSSTRVLIALGLFRGYEDLKNKELIFDSIEQVINHHS